MDSKLRLLTEKEFNWCMPCDVIRWFSEKPILNETVYVDEIEFIRSIINSLFHKGPKGMPCSRWDYVQRLEHNFQDLPASFSIVLKSNKRCNDEWVGQFDLDIDPFPEDCTSLTKKQIIHT